MAGKFDLNKNYTAEIDEAVAKGDYATAAKLESEMNDKIDYLDSTGTNQWNAQKSNKYSQYLDTGSSSGKGGGQYVAADPTGADNYHAKNTANQGMGMSASDLALLESYGANWNAATSEEEKAYWHEQAEKLRNSYGYTGGEDGSEYIQLPVVKESGSTPGFSQTEAPTFQDDYSARIDQLLNEILNRDGFSYDISADPLAAQYRAQYTREGQRAMQDTMGQVAARTGGMASSYATTAAAQQNNYYMQQLADKYTELYQMAYEMYLDNIDLQVQDMGLLENASDRQYDRFRDTMADWRDDRNFAYQQYRDDVADGKWQAGFNRDVLESDRDFDYMVGRDEIEDTRYEDKLAYDRAQDALKGTGSGNSGGSNPGKSPSKPTLTAAQTLAALENGVINDTTKAAYEYYYGEPYEGGNGAPGTEEEEFTGSSGYNNVLATIDRAPGLTRYDKLNIVEDAYNNGRLSDEEAERLLNHIDEMEG